MAKPRIVLIDDDRAWIESVASLLRGEGYDVRSAHDGREGLDVIARSVPSLVVLDLNLPHLSGLEVLGELQRRGLRVPVLVVSADSDHSTTNMALSAGATRVLPKPISAEMVRWTVRGLTNPEVRPQTHTRRQNRRFVA